jgi:Tol biopolymer transport system component
VNRFVLLLASVALAVLLFGYAASAQTASEDGRIVFTRYADSEAGIYTMNPDGSDVVKVTDSGVYPALSPDGTKIAFSDVPPGTPTSHLGYHDIYTMNVDGSNLTNVTNHPAQDFQPAWSPDGEQLVFTSRYGERESNNPGWAQIYTINADGSNTTRLTDSEGHNQYPTWSPTGKIAFSNGGTIYVMNADGSDLSALTGGFDPDWSSDGSKLVFNGWEPEPYYSQIYSINADGSNRTRLTNEPANVTVRFPSWSPSGDRIAFMRQTGYGNDQTPGEIYVMNADGSNHTNITNNQIIDFGPDWQSIPAPPPSDADTDGVSDASDNCPDVANVDQADLDNDGQGNACDGDRDGDGVPNDSDYAPDDPNVQNPPPPLAPTTKQQCKNGGYAVFGFKSQGQCIKAVTQTR